MITKMQTLAVALCAVGLSVLAPVAQCERGGRRISSGTQPSRFKSPCGTADEISKRTGGCLQPIFELIEGNFGRPNEDQDILGHCGRFNTTEKCVRSISKDCLSGIHKTASGAVASATRRFRQTECKSRETRGRYMEPLRCSITNGPTMKLLYQKHTGILQGVRDLPIAPEEKLVKMCCLLNELDVSIAEVFDKSCPESTATVLAIVHAMTDDARNTLCLNPRCKGALDKVKNTKYKPPQNFIEPVMQILFQINV